MKRILIKISSIIIPLIAVVYAVHPVTAHAGIVDFYCFFNPATCGGSFTASGFVNGTIAFIGNTILMISSLFVTYAGILLNVSIVLTLNIKAIYEASPAIDQIWLLIRNLSSMFIIFALVFTSVLTILDISKTSATQLIKNIIIAGLLINFSLFFTKTVIDASNLVSLQFYRAIVPNSVTIDKDNIKSIISSSWQAGGLSDIFMQNLKITSIYNNKKGLITGAADTDFLNIIIASILGSILMILAAGSFAIMSFAFIIRVVVLILLMGFSPVYFVGIIFPQVKDSMSKKWLNWLISQLTFMPVYLLLMYVSIRFLTGINGTGFFNQLDVAKNVTGSTNGVLLSSIGIILQYFIAYFMLGVPLLVALKMGGKSTEWGANAQKWVGGAVGGFIGRNTAGRFARFAGNKFDNMAANAQDSKTGRVATSVLRNLGVSQAVRGQINKYEKGKYGSSQSLADIEKEDKDRGRVIAGVKRFNDQKSTLNKVLMTNKPPSDAELKTFRDTLGKMGVKEFEKVDFKMLTNPVFASNLTSAQAEKISESDFLTEAQKEQFKDIRKSQLNEVLEKGDPNIIKEHMKGLSGKELMKMKLDVYNNTSVIDNMTPSQLKDMSDLDGKARKKIGDYISGLGAGVSHKASGYIRSNRDEWS